jgi:hypothetical protein
LPARISVARTLAIGALAYPEKLGFYYSEPGSNGRGFAPAIISEAADLSAE